MPDGIWAFWKPVSYMAALWTDIPLWNAVPLSALCLDQWPFISPPAPIRWAWRLMSSVWVWRTTLQESCLSFVAAVCNIAVIMCTHNYNIQNGLLILCFNDSYSAHCGMFMSWHRDGEEINAYCFDIFCFIIKGIFLLNHQAWQKNLGETLHTFIPVGYTSNLLFIQSSHLHSFLTLWWEAVDAFALKLLQAASFLSTWYVDSLMEAAVIITVKPVII